MPARHGRKHGTVGRKALDAHGAGRGVTVSARDKGTPVKRDPANHRRASQTAPRVPPGMFSQNTRKCIRFALQRTWFYKLPQSITEYQPLGDPRAKNHNSTTIPQNTVKGNVTAKCVLSCGPTTTHSATSHDCT